jgi:diguanylate cyclase (GGDEF)-like protein
MGKRMPAGGYPIEQNKRTELLRRLIDAGLSVQRGRPLEGPDAVLRCAPFVAAGLLSFAILPLLPDPTNWGNLVAAALVPVILGSVVVVPWHRLPAWVQAVPTLLVFVAVAFVRSTHDSPVAAYTPVVFLPVFWFALYGSRGQLLVSIIAVGVTFAFPTPMDDGYPVTVPAAALLWMVIAGIAGFTVSELVRQREGLQDSMARMARTDVLTGLPNRRAWEEELEREIQRAARSGRPLSAALLDLDHFKEFNDLNGHQAGDEHLEQVAAVWRHRLRSTDLIARHGGEEFAVLLTGTGLDEAREVIEAMRGVVPLGETVSAGIGEWGGGETGRQLMARADLALYEAKRTGRDRTVTAREPALHQA